MSPWRLRPPGRPLSSLAIAGNGHVPGGGEAAQLGDSSHRSTDVVRCARLSPMSTFKDSDGDDDHAGRLAQLERRIALLERAVRSYGIPVPVAYEGESSEAAVSPTVRQFLSQGNKVAAIKALVQETGMGLQQAKDIIDRL